MALAVSETGALDAEVVQREKLRTIKADGSLQVWPAARDGQFGGYAGLQTYLRAEVLPSMSDRELAVRGLLMVGVPGTGKSLAARVCGGILGWPVIRWDVTACKGSLVGETERRMREATARLEALAPAVVVVDEIEKAVGGHASSANTDSGVTLGQVGHLLTWLQEHTAPLFVVMTCNDYAKLPPELTRPGRIDAQFFLDVPSASERAEIAAIHLKRFGQSGAEAMAPVVAEIASDWTGAEIEGLVRSAARQTRREITEASLRESSRHIRPIVRTRASEITALRQWAREALRPASASETVTIQAPARQVRRMAAEG
jgi:SpoVK/Ycf46/Vps4 family AAA+-type ATPase